MFRHQLLHVSYHGSGEHRGQDSGLFEQNDSTKLDPSYRLYPCLLSGGSAFTTLKAAQDVQEAVCLRLREGQNYKIYCKYKVTLHFVTLLKNNGHFKFFKR